MTLHKIISGGQTGADQGALQAAKALGLATGGWAPKGFRTETGPCLALASFGVQEHSNPNYPPRTFLNVLESKGTLLFGNAKSPGCKLTARYCTDNSRPYFHVRWQSGGAPPDQRVRDNFRIWLLAFSIDVLNCAGNRESKQPGIQAACFNFLIDTLGPQAPPHSKENINA
jgi:hypothetical protein